MPQNPVMVIKKKRTSRSRKRNKLVFVAQDIAQRLQGLLALDAIPECGFEIGEVVVLECARHDLGQQVRR